MEERTIAVTGLGYVGFPVAVAFARVGFRVVGFDIDDGRIGDLRSGLDRTNEVEAADLNQLGLNAKPYVTPMQTPFFRWRGAR